METIVVIRDRKINDSTVQRFDKSLEEFYALCDQLELCLRLAHECLSQSIDSAKHSPNLVPTATKPDTVQTESLVRVIANMFSEEEWTDFMLVNERVQSAVKTDYARGKHKVISKHCLKRTLQTLGSAPEWERIKTNAGTDEETDEAALHLWKKKKQRCKKQKRFCTGIRGDVGRKSDTLQKLVKKKQAKLKVDTACAEQSRTYAGSKKCKAVGVSMDKISRQQWKNKMKNRRRCKNKFLLNSAAVADLKLEENLRQIQDLSEVSVNKNLNVIISTGMPEKTQAITDSVNKGTHHVTLTEPVCDRTCQRPVKVDGKKMAKKLQSLLNIQVNQAYRAIKSAKDKKRRNHEHEKDVLLKDNEYQMDRSSALRSRMKKRLESARFRYINELLYTSTSGEAKYIFQQDPDAIKIYHRGYTEQVKHWPANPVDTIISYLRQRSSSLVIADFGCGDCKIARSVKNKVHCFDLAPVCHMVTACDMANVPLGDSTVDIAVFCLSLMGTNLADFLAEANRVLVMGGVLKIAEVASRFDNIRQFAGALSHLGFKLVSKDTDNSHFYSFEFVKKNSAPKNVIKIGLELKPCLYKKR
ncbi:Ribosomal RNA-processing protein 8 [Bagarius yarrelli]|uniref:Ribosomal RNA-processing protein 8 n=1 Tax=Bagarius yarrelli TaxID=175774 RepID=A0A556V829_BAGYA|nr:Ribosomal RNA-processing protein 8 [Bagarius yarrelli]